METMDVVGTEMAQMACWWCS